MNSKIVSEPTGEQMTLFSPVGSLNYASRTALQENDLEKKMTVISGLTVLKQLGSLNQITAFSKTFSELLIGMGDWYSTRCRLTWKLKGTKYKRLYFQLAPSTPRTEETGFGLLRTPTSAEAKNQSCSTQIYLQDQLGITNKLLPTPQAIDGNGHGRDLRLKKDCNRDPEQPGSWRGDLKDFATMGLLPTPTAASDAKGGCTRPDPKRQNDTLAHAMHAATGGQTGTTSQLNPQFVLEMMGFLPSHTEKPFQKNIIWTEV